MSQFQSSDPFQAALEQIDALARAATAATHVSATVETDLVTVTMSAAPMIESIDYPWGAFRGHGAEVLADATRAAIAEAVVQVQAAQAESLRSTPALASLLDATTVDGAEVPPEVAQRAREDAAALAAQEFTATGTDGLVEVTVDGSGVVSRLWLSATAGRESAAEWLAESVTSTVNEALTQARRARESLLSGGETMDLEAELDVIMSAHEARLDALTARLDEVTRRLDLE